MTPHQTTAAKAARPAAAPGPAIPAPVHAHRPAADVGLDPELAQGLAQRSPPRLLYVSCALESLQEDIVRLTSERSLRLVSLTGFNMFPYTPHLETVACFERV